MDVELCSVDSCTTNSILKETKYFQTLTKRQGNVLTIAGRDAMIDGCGRATITLLIGTQITIEDALLYPDSMCTLLSFRDIRQNGFHIETHDDNNEEFLLITKNSKYGAQTIEKISSFPSGLYYAYIKPVPYIAYKVIFQNVDTFQTWHDRFCHPSTGMMRKIISNSNCHDMHPYQFP
ncbi:hypothetical protein BS78_03G166800 [Paspalum vaginatum]|nr:hypothetical protein BS78_03G166800 [Paspalum vaginatum]